MILKPRFYRHQNIDDEMLKHRKIPYAKTVRKYLQKNENEHFILPVTGNSFLPEFLDLPLINCKICIIQMSQKLVINLLKKKCVNLNYYINLQTERITENATKEFHLYLSIFQKLYAPPDKYCFAFA